MPCILIGAIFCDNDGSVMVDKLQRELDGYIVIIVI